jgi:hypothetical protein
LNTTGVVLSAGNVTAPYFIGNVVGNITGNLSAPGSNTQVIFNVNNIANANANFTFDKTTNALTASGTITGGNISTGGNLSAVGNTILGGNLTVGGTNNYFNAVNFNALDPIPGFGRLANNQPLIATDNKDRGTQLYYYDTSEKSAFLGYQASSGKLIAAVAATVTNEVVIVNTAGTMVVGTLEGAGVSVTGNVTGGNLRTAGLVSVAGSVTAGTTVSAAGNINGGNVVSAALVQGTTLSVTGNTATVTTANYQIGYRDLPQLTSFGTLAATDGGKHYYGTGTIIIPASGTTNFAIGTAVLIIASNSTAINAVGGVTLIQAGTGTAGNRTLAQYGEASLVKVATDTWYISGVGIS